MSLTKNPFVRFGIVLGVTAAAVVGGIGLGAVVDQAGSAPALTPEQSYLRAIHAKLDGKVLIYDDKIVSAGRVGCQTIPDPGVTHSRLVAAAAQGLMTNQIPDPFGAAEVIVSAAERYLCPTVHYSAVTE